MQGGTWCPAAVTAAQGFCTLPPRPPATHPLPIMSHFNHWKWSWPRGKQCSGYKPRQGAGGTSLPPLLDVHLAWGKLGRCLSPWEQPQASTSPAKPATGGCMHPGSPRTGALLPLGKGSFGGGLPSGRWLPPLADGGQGKQLVTRQRHIRCSPEPHGVAGEGEQVTGPHPRCPRKRSCRGSRWHPVRQQSQSG